MSCLFNSLTKLLQDEFTKFKNGTTLRDIVCDYINERPNEKLNGIEIKEWIDLVKNDEFGTNIEDYSTYMRQSSTWGGAPEISLISKLFNVEIEVIYNNKPISNFICCPTPKSKLRIAWTGGHYEPIERIYYSI